MRSVLALAGLALLVVPLAAAQLDAPTAVDGAAPFAAGDDGGPAFGPLEALADGGSSAEPDGDAPALPSFAMVHPPVSPRIPSAAVMFCFNEFHSTFVGLPTTSCGGAVIWPGAEDVVVMEEPAAPPEAPEPAPPAGNETEPARPVEETAAPQQMPFAAAPAPSAPETAPQAPHAGSPRPGREAGLREAAGRPAGQLSWALAATAVALPGALLAKLASILALRRSRRDAQPTLRQAVLDAVARQPGIRHRELVRRIGHGNGTVEHHVRALLAEGRVARVRRGGSTAYFPAGAMPPDQALLRLALHGRTSRLLALDVAAHPGSRLTEVARRLGVSLATAHYQAGKLVAAGVLRDAAGPRGRRLEATPSGHATIAAVMGADGAMPMGESLPSDGSHLPSLA
jgi:DNA-binding MarR family transcriptional regulator